MWKRIQGRSVAAVCSSLNIMVHMTELAPGLTKVLLVTGMLVRS